MGSWSIPNLRYRRRLDCSSEYNYQAKRQRVPSTFAGVLLVRVFWLDFPHRCLSGLARTPVGARINRREKKGNKCHVNVSCLRWSVFFAPACFVFRPLCALVIKPPGTMCNLYLNSKSDSVPVYSLPPCMLIYCSLRWEQGVCVCVSRVRVA